MNDLHASVVFRDPIFTCGDIDFPFAPNTGIDFCTAANDVRVVCLAVVETFSLYGNFAFLNLETV